MNPLTTEALQILIFLLPGFVSQRVLDTVVVRKQRSELGKIIEALIFTMLIYTIYSLVIGKSPVSVEQVVKNNVTNIAYSFNGVSFLWLFAFSVAVPLVMGFLFTTDLHMKALRYLKVTRKTSRESVWFDVFCDIRCPIIVNFEDERRLFGWPQYYSNDPQDMFLYLTHAQWIVQESEEGKSPYLDTESIGVLITPNQKIESIQFVSMDDERKDDADG